VKITEGFVAVAEDGTFITMYETDTHTGHHIRWGETPDIEMATVFHGQHFGSRSNRFSNAPTATFVPVEVRREVILKGYGVGK
jgi:nitrite reductase/ring-hydroxylating ferredoxin subunit